MSKLSYEQRIDIYNERKNVIQYMVSLIDKHGIDILRKNKNNVYPKYKKEKIINRVLNGGEPVWTVAIENLVLCVVLILCSINLMANGII